MSLRHRLMPYVASAITSTRTRDLVRQLHEWRRQLRSQPHRVTVWLRLDDPYSALLLQVLPRFHDHFAIELDCRLVNELPPEMYPAPEQLRDYALIDGGRLAAWHHLQFPSPARQPEPSEVALGERILLALESQPIEHYLTVARQVFTAVWEQQPAKLRTLAERFPPLSDEDAARRLEQHNDALRHAGHYQSATLHYGGEWYWGLDRLDHLADRLQDLGLNQHDYHFALHPESTGFDSDFLIIDFEQLSRIRAQKLELDFYFSFRSPYSYLALERSFRLAEHYGLQLTVKPVLPMVMRGLPVPRNKRFYILHDAKRQAEQHHIPFGQICDPVGKGVERCLALFEASRDAGCERDYLLSIGRGIWAEGRDVSRDHDLAALVSRAGLNWAELQPRLHDESWRSQAERHRQELTALGLWGVPTFYLRTPQQGQAIWGQDRLWALEALIADFAVESAKH